MANDWVVVSYYTKDYKAIAGNLIRSLKEKNIRYDIEELCSQGSWLKDTSFKPTFLKKKIREHDTPIVWMDTDNEIIEYPELLDICHEDIAVYYECLKKLNSSVIYLANNDRVRFILDKWEELCYKRPAIWDQMNLQDVLNGWWIERRYISVMVLPDSYQYVEIDGKGLYGDTKVIKHYRGFKRKKEILSGSVHGV